MARIGSKTDRAQRCAGFTLAETLVTLLLTAFLSSFFLFCFFSAAEQYRQHSALLELEDNLQLAAQCLAQEIAASTAVLQCDSDQLVLQQDLVIYYTLGEDPQGAEHFYPLEGKILYRKEHTQWNRQPMANFITALEFVYLDHAGAVVETPQDVRAVAFYLEGTWQGRRLRQRQVVRLAGSDYL